MSVSTTLVVLTEPTLVEFQLEMEEEEGVASAIWEGGMEGVAIIASPGREMGGTRDPGTTGEG